MGAGRCGTTVARGRSTESLEVIGTVGADLSKRTWHRAEIRCLRSGCVLANRRHSEPARVSIGPRRMSPRIACNVAILGAGIRRIVGHRGCGGSCNSTGERRPMTSNKSVERTVGQGGPHLSAARSSWPAVQLNR